MGIYVRTYEGHLDGARLRDESSAWWTGVPMGEGTWDDNIKLGREQSRSFAYLWLLNKNPAVPRYIRHLGQSFSWSGFWLYWMSCPNNSKELQSSKLLLFCSQWDFAIATGLPHPNTAVSTGLAQALSCRTVSVRVTFGSCTFLPLPRNTIPRVSTVPSGLGSLVSLSHFQHSLPSLLFCFSLYP